MAVDVLAQARAKIEQRLEELAQESQALNRAFQSLQNKPNEHSSAPPPRRNRRKRARPGQRRQQFLGAVKEQPGVTVARVAKGIGTAPNPLYAIAHQLVKEKEIEKDGSGYRIAKASPKKGASPKQKTSSKGKASPKKGRKSRKA